MVGEACQKSFQGLEEIGLRRPKINRQKAEGLQNALYVYKWAFCGEKENRLLRKNLTE